MKHKLHFSLIWISFAIQFFFKHGFHPKAFRLTYNIKMTSGNYVFILNLLHSVSCLINRKLISVALMKFESSAFPSFSKNFFKSSSNFEKPILKYNLKFYILVVLNFAHTRLVTYLRSNWFFTCHLSTFFRKNIECVIEYLDLPWWEKKKAFS